MLIINASKKQVLSDQCRLANNFIKRVVGLLNRSSMRPGEGLLLDNCHGIHTLGMRFPIDVVFLDRGLRVLRLAHRVPPFRIGPAAKGAVYVLELPAGTLKETQTEIGDQVQLRTGPDTPTPSPSSNDPSLQSLSDATPGPGAER
jgi:uncharacterized membrane protein (UPF0127 family)